MIDALIKVIDRLIQLVETRKRFNRQMFEDHIDPIYKDLQAIVDDYREIILAIETKLNRGKTEKVLKELITRREKYARVRDEVKKYADALANAKLNEDVYNFAQSCGNLFLFEPTMRRGSPVRSALTSLLDDIAFVTEYRRELTKPPHERLPQYTQYRRETKPASHISLSNLIADYKYGLGHRWDDISSKYFRLRAEYLK
jgi:hypothetical protein